MKFVLCCIFPIQSQQPQIRPEKSIEELEQKVVAGTLFFPRLSKKSSKYQRGIPHSQPSGCPRPLSFSVYLFPGVDASAKMWEVL
jgi:hypothetical protein